MSRAIEDSLTIRNALRTAWEEYTRLADKAKTKEDKAKWSQYRDEARHVLKKLYNE